jgi:hypothetical protein
VISVAAVFLTTAAGCFGRFRAVNAIYDFNKDATDNGVVRSLLMVGLLFVQAYTVAFLIDAIVLNTMDFFNGTNKVAAVQTLPDGTNVEMAKLDADTVRVRQVDPAGRERTFDIVRVGPGAGYVRTSDGHIMGTAERLSDGRILQQAR